MNPTAATITDALVEAIRRVADPERIILFGSRARGDAGPDSDVDLLIVQDRAAWKTPSRRLETVRIQRGLPRLRLPVDILLFTPEEADKWRTARNHVVARAFEEGLVLYERP